MHQWTGVDKLHAAGIRGKGATVAIIDTGIDYTHKAVSAITNSLRLVAVTKTHSSVAALDLDVRLLAAMIWWARSVSISYHITTREFIGID